MAIHEIFHKYLQEYREALILKKTLGPKHIDTIDLYKRANETKRLLMSEIKNAEDYIKQKIKEEKLIKNR